jgi:hypothetical protein
MKTTAADWFRRWRGWSSWALRSRLWQLHPPVALIVGAPQAAVMQTLKSAARPSQDRLHLRGLFTDGRRYTIEPHESGFKLTSSTRVLGSNRQRRSRVAAIVTGSLSAADSLADAGNPITIVRLHTRISLPYLLSALIIPAFMSSIILLTPWHPVVIALLVIGLFALSLFGHRSNAALQAGENIYFARKVLEDLPSAELLTLPTRTPDIVARDGAGGSFSEQWGKFYEQQVGQTHRAP